MGICFPDNEEKTSLGGIKMESLKELYKVGNWTFKLTYNGTTKSCRSIFNEINTLEAASYKAHLYGSLAATGEGHLTDYIINENA